MSTARAERIHRLSDDELVASLRDVVSRTHLLTAELLVHLVEVEDRELHLKAACSSMFAYCTEVLGFDEAQAYHRIYVARLARRFPAVLELVADGRLNLSGLRLLAPHLTEDNLGELCEAAAGKSKRQIERLLAARAPKPDVPTTVRKLPRRTGACPGASALRGTEPAEAPASSTGEAAVVAADAVPAAGDRTRTAPERDSRCATEPLAADRYRVAFTASAELVDRLERVRALMSHRGRKGDVPQVLEAALELLEARLLKERFGAGARPRRQAAKPARSKTTRHVPRAVRREVLARDGLRCAFVDPATGKRCGERRVELQHHRPFALGGPHSADNLSLYCSAHNRFAARQDYGREHIEEAVRRSRGSLAGGRLPSAVAAERPGPGTSGSAQLVLAGLT